MRTLIFSHTTGYQLRAFNDAAEEMGLELVFATDRCHKLDDPWQDRAVPVRFHDLDASLRAVERAQRERPVDGVVAVGDRPVVLAARAAEALGLTWHTPAGAQASSDKRRSRAAFAAAGLPSPRFELIPLEDRLPAWTRFPCVLKPLGLSGSRGVIRANTPEEFAAAFARIRALLARPQIRAQRSGLEEAILVEDYVDGAEYALEGVLTRGALTPFALFDKPDPLTGPFFEETIYVTPSRLPAGTQRAMIETVATGARALGLWHGPIHAECRIDASGAVFVLEIAARPIGGLCGRVLRFTRAESAGAFGGAHESDTLSLEHVLLAHAVGRPLDAYRPVDRGSAVMMIPIPRRGLLKGVTGEDAARGIEGVDDVRITAKPDQLLEPLPEAGSYLGFIFAHGDVAASAERRVREAHACLRFTIAAPIPVQTAP